MMSFFSKAHLWYSESTSCNVLTSGLWPA